MKELDVNTVEEINLWCQKINNIKKDYVTNIIDQNRLSSVLQNVNQTFDGQDIYDTIYLKASFLWYSLSQSHCFIDGNKRTALVSVLIFLSLNGYELNYDERLYEICMDLAKSQVEKEELNHYLEQHCILINRIKDKDEILLDLSKDSVLLDILDKLSK